MNPPNLVFIFTDEQRRDTLAAYHNQLIDMPNLNRFAEDCVIFDRAYCTSPVCTPSRSSILTGLFAHQNGCTENNFPLAANIPCLPELIPDSPYSTGYIGKWHLGDEIFAQHGFEEWVSVEDLYIEHYSSHRDREQRSSYHQFLVNQGFTPDSGSVFSREYCSKLPEIFGKPAFLAAEADRFISKHKNEPFILYVNFLEPHMPYFGPRDNQYDPASIPLPKNFDAYPASDQHKKHQLIAQGYFDRGHSGLPLKTENDWKKLIANYWGLCSLIDTYVGKILSSLERNDLTDNTIVVFTSDHGDMMGSHHLLAKCVMFEEATRIPLLIRLPGSHTQTHINRPVSQVDLVPTLLDLMGQPIPTLLHGASLKTELEGAPNTQPNNVYIEWNGKETGILEHYENNPLPPGLVEITSREELKKIVRDPIRTIVTPRLMKFSFSQAGMHELYNLATDPYETENLAFKPEYQSQIPELINSIALWQQDTHDILPNIG